MRLSVILLFLPLWGNVEVSSSEIDTCKVAGVSGSVRLNTHVPDNQLRKGQKLRFECTNWRDTLRGNAEVECLAGGQWSDPFPTCGAPLGCMTPPPPLADGDTTETRRFQYGHGERVEYTCQNLYTMEGEPHKTCINGEWVGEMRCLNTCKVAGVSGSVRLNTHVPDNQLRKGQKLRFECTNSRDTLRGNAEVECLAGGQWSDPFPTCGAPLGCMTPPPPLADGDTTETRRFQYGHGERVEYTCQNLYTMEGEPHKTCINGEWVGEMRCLNTCKVAGVSGSVRLNTHVPDNQLRKGQKLRFECTNSRDTLRGNAEVECLAGGQWSDPFPTCGAPLGCSTTPPPLADGDTTETRRFQYGHGERVEYTCQYLYKMEGDPHKTCSNGEWVGQMRCLRPCTVDREVMNTHNIQFLYGTNDKLYVAHHDYIQFSCEGGRRHDGRVGMRQKCIDGVMHLPTCH